MSPSAIGHVRDRCGHSAGAAPGWGAPAPGSLQVEQGSQTTLGPSAGGPPVSTAACFWKGALLAAPERRLFPCRGVCDRGEEWGGQRSARACSKGQTVLLYRSRSQSHRLFRLIGRLRWTGEWSSGCWEIITAGKTWFVCSYMKPVKNISGMYFTPKSKKKNKK